MKKLIPLSISLVAIICITVFLAMSPSPNKAEAITAKIERWNNLDRSLIINAVKNVQGETLKSFTFSRAEAEKLLTIDNQADVVYNLAIDQQGSFSFILNSQLVLNESSFGSETPELMKALTYFNSLDYRMSHKQISKDALEHLIDVAPAIKEIERWEMAYDQDLSDAFFTENGMRIRSLSYSSEVLKELLKQSKLESITSFLAINDQDGISLVTMGRDHSGKLMLPNKESNDSFKNSIFNFVAMCPPICPPPRCDNNGECGEGTECRDGRCHPIRTN